MSDDFPGGTGKAEGVCGALLVGGRSSRMGREKALLECGGEMLWRRQWNLLNSCLGTLVVVAPIRPGWLPDDLAWAADADFGNGPAAGLLGALSWAVSRDFHHVCLLAVDMPRASDGMLRVLLEGVRPGVGIVPRCDEGYEPLFAIYPAEAHGPLQDSLRAGENKMQTLVAQMVDQGLLIVRQLSGAEQCEYFNLNTPAEYSQLGGAS